MNEILIILIEITFYGLKLAPSSSFGFACNLHQCFQDQNTYLQGASESKIAKIKSEVNGEGRKHTYFLLLFLPHYTP